MNDQGDSSEPGHGDEVELLRSRIAALHSSVEQLGREGEASSTTNGVWASAVSATVAMVDAGPFEGLIDLRRFEKQLAQLAIVRDVRVRRYGHGRAEIQLGVSEPYGIAGELHHIDRRMSVAETLDGRIAVELEASEPAPEKAATYAEDESAEGGSS